MLKAVLEKKQKKNGLTKKEIPQLLLKKTNWNSGWCGESESFCFQVEGVKACFG